MVFLLELPGAGILILFMLLMFIILLSVGVIVFISTRKQLNEQIALLTSERNLLLAQLKKLTEKEGEVH